MDMNRRAWVTTALIAAMAGSMSIWMPAESSERETPTLLPCRAAATMNEDDLEMWKRIRAALRLGRALDGEYVLVARMLARPTPFPEWVISVYLAKSGDARVTAAIAQKNTYSANHEEVDNRVVLRENPVIEAPKSFAAAIQRPLAESIGRVWLEMLHRAQAPETQRWGTQGGTTYIFSRWVSGKGEICAQTHEPITGSAPHDLKNIAELLLDYSRNEDDRREEIRQSLDEEIVRLERRMNQD